RLELDGMKQHMRIQTSLPCGWTSAALLHKQASLKAMNPEQPFYLLDDGSQAIPPLFYAMLNKSLALPLLEDWLAYLWTTGREQNLITLLDQGKGQGFAAWQVTPSGEAWQNILEAGLQSDQIQF
ncbi:MAG: hypothetical protein KDE34_20025, partial [Anaerolineales bacterium]|nr:hypothetical protein [Anaerolineales bacterium]